MWLAGQLVQQWVASSSLWAGAGWWAARVIGREPWYSQSDPRYGLPGLRSSRAGPRCGLASSRNGMAGPRCGWHNPRNSPRYGLMGLINITAGSKFWNGWS